MSRGRVAAFACAVVMAVVSAGCSTVDHPGRLDRTPSPTGVTRIDPPSTPAPTATPTTAPTSADSGLFTTPPGGKLSLKTPIKLGDKLGPNLPFAGPPPTGPPTAESALIFMRAYMATKTEALYTTDTKTLALYMDAGCECRRYLDSLSRIRSQDRHIEGSSATINDIHINDMPPGAADVGVVFSQGLLKYVDESGAVVKTDPAVSEIGTTYVLGYEQSSKSWKIAHAFG